MLSSVHSNIKGLLSNIKGLSNTSTTTTASRHSTWRSLLGGRSGHNIHHSDRVSVNTLSSSPHSPLSHRRISSYTNKSFFSSRPLCSSSFPPSSDRNPSGSSTSPIGSATGTGLKKKLKSKRILKKNRESNWLRKEQRAQEIKSYTQQLTKSIFGIYNIKLEDVGLEEESQKPENDSQCMPTFTSISDLTRPNNDGSTSSKSSVLPNSKLKSGQSHGKTVKRLKKTKLQSRPSKAVTSPFKIEMAEDIESSITISPNTVQKKTKRKAKGSNQGVTSKSMNSDPLSSTARNPSDKTLGSIYGKEGPPSKSKVNQQVPYKVVSSFSKQVPTKGPQFIVALKQQLEEIDAALDKQKEKPASGFFSRIFGGSAESKVESKKSVQEESKKIGEKNNKKKKKKKFKFLSGIGALKAYYKSKNQMRKYKKLKEAEKTLNQLVPKEILRDKKKVKEFLKELRPMMEAIIFKSRNYLDRNALLPVRPDLYIETWRYRLGRIFEHEGVVVDPGVFPRGAMGIKMINRAAEKEEIALLTPAIIAEISWDFFGRRTHLDFIFIILMLVLAVELYLGVNEAIFQSNPDILDHELDRFLAVKGEALYQALRDNQLDAFIHEANGEWIHTEWGDVPPKLAFWMKESGNTPLPFFLLRRITSHIKNTLLDLNTSIYINYSKVWHYQAQKLKFGAKITKSCLNNTFIPPSIGQRIRPAIAEAFKEEEVATRAVKLGILGGLMESMKAKEERKDWDEDSSVEALILHTILQHDKAISTFWDQPSIALKDQLEAFILNVEQHPRFIGFALAKLSRGRPPHIMMSNSTNGTNNNSNTAQFSYLASLVDGCIQALCEKDFGSQSVSNMGMLAYANWNRLSQDDKLLLNLSSLPEYNFETNEIYYQLSPIKIPVVLFMSYYVVKRYWRMGMWNALGVLPYPVRVNVMLKGAIPALMATGIWFTLDIISPHFFRLLPYRQHLEQAKLEQIKQDLQEQQEDSSSEDGMKQLHRKLLTAEEVLTQQGGTKPPNPFLAALATFSYSIPIYYIKASLLWRFPFILMPQLIHSWSVYPIAKYRLWRHRRSQSTPVTKRLHDVFPKD